ncbi:hypothetical protein J6590_026286 [Homalodisca vitripennis]|nr:hypothetical protein J6590_026286 [Homalodisca vitripennis]
MTSALYYTKINVTVSGVAVHTTTSVVSVICILYTTIGGLRAVIWTDAIQTVFMVLSMVLIIVLGLSKVGGITEVFTLADQGHRLEFFNLDPDPFARHTLCSMLLGCTFTLLAYQACSPGTIQRFIAVPTQLAAKRVIMWSTAGFIGMNTLAVLVGLILYARYHHCDPIATQKVKFSGQLLPMFVMELGAQIPGFSGLFIAGVFSAALSTMSAGLNTAAGTVYEDFVLRIHSQHSDSAGALIVKLIALVFGIASVLLVFFVSKLGGILQLALSLLGVTHGAILFLFTFGMFFPWGSTKGALSGAAASLAVMAFFVVRAQVAIAHRHIQFPGKSLSIDGCEGALNMTHLLISSHTGIGSQTWTDGSEPKIYQLSYLYYNLLGALVGFLVGIPVSIFTRAPLGDLDPRLIVPQLRWLLPLKHKKRPSKVFPMDDDVTASDSREMACVMSM